MNISISETLWYRIRYAVYNLTSDLITQELIKAARAGVHVQVLIESEQLNQDRTWISQ